MICDDRFVNYIKPKAESGLCEVGIHVHAWNTPPYYELKKEYGGNPYLIEYPYEIMREKFAVTYNLINKRIGIAPVSHRAGRWVMNNDYFQLLKEFGVKVDCSYTPLEVPMTIRKIHSYGDGSFKQNIRSLIKGELVWLRPALTTMKRMKKLCQNVSKEKDNDYIEFMLHSSELMAGGSPYFKTESAINELYQDIKLLFSYVASIGYEGITLTDYDKNKKA